MHEVQKFHLEGLPSPDQEIHTELFEELQWDTPKSMTFDGYNLPRSHIAVRKLSKGYEVEMPAWLAKKKGILK